MLLKPAIASLVSIIILFIVTKLLGNKQISQLNMFDYVNGITIGSVAAEMATGNSLDEMIKAAVAIVVYGAAGILMTFITLKSIHCRHFISGREKILIADGKLYPHSIKRARLDVNDLLTKARISGYYDISDIQYAILENNGEISFLPKKQASPPTLSDILPAVDCGNQPKPPVYVIIDGRVLHENLKASGRDETWLSRRLKEQKLGRAEDIFLAFVDENGELVAYESIGGEPPQDIFS